VNRLAALLLFTTLTLTADSGTLTTVAGNGIQAYAGDGGPAVNASLWNPSDVIVDAAGNLYIAEASSHRVRKVSAAGLITTVAGIGGFWSNLGDGGPATSAGLAHPAQVALDGAGNLYITEVSGGRVRRVSAGTGVITTVAGNSGYGYNGDGIPATSASLTYPFGVVVDGSGNIYICEIGTSRVRRVDAATGIITTVAGNGGWGYSGDGGPATQAELSSPAGIALDGAGNLYIAHQDHSVIRKVNAATGIITTVAGNGVTGYSGDGGPATAASLGQAPDITVDAAGNLFIADAA